MRTAISEDALIDEAGALQAWRESPTKMVRDLFGVEPDPPQREALEAFPHSPRLAMQSCTGAGKTATLSWLGWNFLLTRSHPMVGATSISGDNLRANLWPELARWYAAQPLLQRVFKMTKTEIFAYAHPKTWRLEARTWAKDADASQIGNVLRGLHAKNIMWLLDETGNYPDAVLPVCEAIFSGEPDEAHVCQAGNPTRRSGPLWHAATRARALWKVIRITADPDDPHRTTRVSIEHAREQIAQWGRDNPWVIVNIFGEFPASDINALIGPDEVEAAMKRYYRPFEIGRASKVLGVDVARFGDDASVIAPRQGIQCFPFKKYRNIDSIQGAGAVSRIWTDFGADACFVDDTGGYGAGWIDNLRGLGRAPIGVGFARQAHDPLRFANKRAEMTWDGVEWIKRGGALPMIPELSAALTQTTYSFMGDKILLEPKDDVKKKLGYSPDDFDAFILTFAEPVQPKDHGPPPKPRGQPEEWDPFAERGLDGGRSSSYSRKDDYDPYA